MKTIAITIEEDVLEQVDRLVGMGGTAESGNRSKIIRTAVREYLGRVQRAAEADHERAILKRHAGRLARQAAALVKEQAKP
jgi:metal-responsive CopG/Arc/MetJ family transcriptional regulator